MPAFAPHSPPPGEHAPTWHPVRSITRLFRLWWLYARLDLVWITRDYRNCALYLLGDLVLAVASVTGALLLAERFGGIGQWTRPQVVFLLAYGVLSREILDAFANFNILFISRRIGRGQLDHVLVQPQPLWMAFATEGFIPFSGIMMVLPGVVLMAWAAHDLGLPPSPAWLGLFALNLASSSAIIVAFSYLWGTIAFWAPRAAEEINSSTGRMISQLKPFPLDAAGPLVLGGLSTLLPIAWVAWYPSRALLGLDSLPAAPFVTPAVAVLFSAAAAWVFKRGLKEYGRTGSQRYSDFGHRR